MLCEELKSEEVAKVNDFYRKTAYFRSVTEKERVFIVRDEGKIVGALCVESEADIRVLRGMYVLPELVRKKIGTTLLQFIEPVLKDKDAYCIPYRHLEGFYETIGFKAVDVNGTPDFIANRFNLYCAKGLEVLIMYRPKG